MIWIFSNYNIVLVHQMEVIICTNFCEVQTEN